MHLVLVLVSMVQKKQKRCIPKGIGAKIPEMPVVELPDTAESRDSHSAHSGDSGEEVVPL